MSAKTSIFLHHIQHNLQALVAHCRPGILFSAAVKANAYGHGLAECAHIFSKCDGPAYGSPKVLHALAVSRSCEVEIIREAGVDMRLIVYSHVGGKDLNTLFSSSLHYNVEFFVDSVAYVRDILAAMRKYGIELPLRVHLKCDTGMGRLGALPQDFPALYEYAIAEPSVLVVGICTHLSDSSNDRMTQQQREVFADILAAANRDNILVHAGNSGALLWNKNMHYDMLRPGIVLYGVYPEITRSPPGNIHLLPAMKFYSEVACIKKLPQGHGISYLSTYTLPRTTHIGVINAGYGDGVPVCLSNKGQVAIRGKKYPIIGRVCMDMCMVDIGNNSDVEAGDEAVFWGDATLSVEEQAESSGSIAYEFLCRVGAHHRVEKSFYLK